MADTEKRIRAEMAGVEQRMASMVSTVAVVRQELAKVKAARQSIRQEVRELEQAVGPGIKTIRKQVGRAQRNVGDRSRSTTLVTGGEKTQCLCTPQTVLHAHVIASCIVPRGWQW